MRFLVLLAILSGLWSVKADDATNLSPIISLLRKASNGDPDAEFELGKRYNHGRGVKQNGAEAVKWFEKAAGHGIVEAQMMVAIQYWNGVDVDLDEAKGVKWFEKASENAEPGAFHYLGAAYYLGKGVKQDFVQSYKWTLLFKDSGRSVIPDDAASMESRVADLEKKMTPEQITEGNRLAKELKERLSKMPRFSKGP